MNHDVMDFVFSSQCCFPSGIESEFGLVRRFFLAYADLNMIAINHETSIFAPENGWLEDVCLSFWEGRPTFRCYC